MTLEDAIKKAIDGKAVIITGAGFNAGVKNIENEQMPFANELSKTLCEEAKVNEELKLEDIVDYYIQENKKDKLCDILRKNFTAKHEQNEVQEIIASIKWQAIYTTNYDNVFEVSSDNAQYKRSPAVLSQKCKHCENDAIVHINGYVDRINNKTIEDEVKLSSQSYLLDCFINKTEWYSKFEQDIDSCYVIFIVGVSLNFDMDLRKIFIDESYKDKIVIIDNVIPDNMTVAQRIKLRNKQVFGEVYNIGLECFAQRINEMKLTYKPLELNMIFTCFETCSDKSIGKIPRVSDLRDLLTFGYIDEPLVSSNLSNNNYIICRQEAKDVISTINTSKNNCCICVTSDYCNGKTCFVEQLKYELLKIGKVFLFKHQNNNLAEEISYICSIKDKVIIILENYANEIEILKKLSVILSTNSENVYFIVTARTSIHNYQKGKLEEILKLPPDDIYELDLNIINENDIGKFVNLLVKSSYWDKYRKLKYEPKKAILTNTCRSRINEILFKQIQSRQVEQELQEIINNLEQKQFLYDLVLAIVILSRLSIRIELNDLLKILNFKGMLSNEIKSNEIINQIVNISTNNIRVNSSIFTSYFLETNKAKKERIAMLERLNLNADKAIHKDKTHAIRRTSISISNINFLFNTRNERNDNVCSKVILNYFNNIKSIDTYEELPYFWLQYAIAAMNVKDYPLARSQLDIAYNCKKDSYFDTYQLDTQNGRFILEYNCLSTVNALYPFDTIKSVDNIFKTVLKNSKVQAHLVYKQITLYKPFIEKYVHMFDSKQKNQLYKIINGYNLSIDEEIYDTKKSKTIIEECIRYKSIFKETCTLLLSSTSTNNIVVTIK